MWPPVNARSAFNSEGKKQLDKLQFEFYHIIIPYFPQEIKCHRVNSTTGLLSSSLAVRKSKKVLHFRPLRGIMVSSNYAGGLP